MKKTIKKPFDLEAAKNGAKVETRNGYKVTLAEERKPTYPVCGTFPYKGETRSGQWRENGEWDNNPNLDLVIVEYEDEDKDKEEAVHTISEEVELNLTYCDNGIFYEVHYKNDDSNSDKSIICPRDEQVNRLGEYLLSLIRDRMDSGLTNKVKIEMKLTPILLNKK
jgi:hypothetical protein